MIVVSDTTPLISLMKIGQLDLVHRLFGEIRVPEAVFKELVSNKRFKKEIIQIEENPYIKNVKLKDVDEIENLRNSTGLDVGESEAIILAELINANLLLMDEIRGRRVAQQKGIQIMGTVGMLMIAYKERLLSREEVIECVDVLRNSGRHISEKLYLQLMEKIDEDN